MTANTRRNRRNRTEIDIATQYFEEEKERTKEALKRKKLKTQGIRPSSKPTQIKKKKDHQTKKPFRKTPKSHAQTKKNTPTKPKTIRNRTVMKQKRNSKVKKRARGQFFNRFKI